ncbi:HMI1 [Candida oxycetoniae]|uniref:DNA 3'-5' helicase n=1 Tax=Candida oxycetoniae TaxID=497107 RepID=A0AAI9X0G3_9ASCO|nr:HMI1 [Candida oxycetoniae]KAI3407015.2 HMI1 [Candida oxycetoniae]
MILTPSQRLAVTRGFQPGRILSIQSGPGCGKSLCIAKRIEFMLNRGVAPEEIIVLSMTNRAVNSLKKTISNSFGSRVDDLVIKTFHSFASMIVDGHQATYFPNRPPNSVMDDSNWRSFARFFGAKYHALEKAVDEVNHGSPIESVAEINSIPVAKLKETVKYLEDNGIVRYSGLITSAMKLMDKSGDNLPLANAKVLVIDEFQDMHPKLLQFIKKIALYGTPKHITLAGDKNQCIYEFLMSYPTITEDFIKELGFPSEEVVLKETFRLTPQILKEANSIIRTDIQSAKATGLEIMKQEDLCTDIVELIALSGGLLRFSDLIVLVRTNKEVDDISQTLTEKYGIKCNKYNGQDWVNSELHIFLDVLHILRRSYGSDFALLLMFERLGMKKNELKDLFVAYKQWNKSNENKLEEFLRMNLKNEKEKFAEFLDCVQAERYELDTPVSIMGSLGRITQKFNLLPWSSKLQENLNSFFLSLEYSYMNYSKDPTSTFIEYFLSHYHEAEPILEDNSVNISTVHKAKGLEFPVVFIPSRRGFSSRLLN